MIKRLLSLMLCVCVMLSCVIAMDYTTINAKAQTIDYGLVDNVQYGQILHCWNWSFDNIRKNMQLIASQGFTAIQTSPIQSSKESTTESWSSVQNSAWVYYQPISFNIETNSWNALGTKTEFKAMCEEAHKYGVKVIVDAVFNHMANDSSENTINPQISSDLRNDSNCWYSITWNTSNWEDRYDVTHNCLSGFPDLNTSNTKVQNYAIGFLKECIDAGADGFRFDAVKHIETPADAYGTASDFWPNVLGTATYHAQQTRGITPYYYGEMLGSPGGGLPITAYTDHMSVTDNNTGNTVRDAIASGNAAGACQPGISNGAAPDKAVQWNESHDTYYADNNSIWISNDNMKKTWAIVGSRAQVCGLYLARPENNETTMLGDGDITAWADEEVKAINRFKNYFAGHPEYLAHSGNIVYNERGNTGVVLVNVAGGKTSVSVPAHKMYDGIYTDAITGNHFSVSNGTISGEIGSSGIAVVYSYPSTVSVSEQSQAFRGDALDITLSYNEATSGTYSINGDYAKSYTDGDVVSVGCGVEYGSEATLLATATGGTTTDSTMEKYKKLHPDTELTMYFDNGSKNWDTVFAYVYNEDGDKNKSWPGIEMMYDSSLGLYKYDVPAGFETSKVVFNNGNGSQTPSSGGHSFNAYTSIYKDGSFYGYNTGVSDKLYFKPSANWLSDNARFAVYVWNSSGKSWLNLKDSDSDGIYEVSLPSGVYTECIFARMNPSTTSNNWDNVWNRTGDLGISNNNNYFIIGDGWNTSDGTWSIIDKSVIGNDSDAVLAGSFNNWDKSANPFVYTDYNQAVAKVDLPAGTYTFKLLKNDAWFGNPGTIKDTTDGNGWRMCKNDSENCTLVASGGTYTFTLNTETLKVNVDYEPGEVISPTTAPTQAPTDAPTELQTDAPTQAPTDAPTTATAAPTEAPTQANTLKAGYYLVGTLNSKDCWGISTLTEDRLLKSNPNNAGEYMLEYTFVKGDAIKVVYYNGTSITTWYGNSDNYNIGSSKAGKGTLYFRPEGNSSWSYNYFTVLPYTYPAGYYLVGTFDGVDKWGIETLSENRLFKENPNNAGEYMLDYSFKNGDEVKVVYYDGTDYTSWYNSSGDNYKIGSSKAGDGTVYFRPQGNSSWSYYYLTVIPDKVEETQAPTEVPTQAPTQAPTEAPTEASTEAPTEEPTEKPTEAPTEASTEAPTEGKPVKVSGVKVSDITDTSMVVSWDETENASVYYVYISESRVYSKTSNTSMTITGLNADTDYNIAVVAKLSDGTYQKRSDADSYDVKTLESTMTSSATTTEDSITISWDAQGATKTWVYYGTSKDNLKVRGSSTTNTYTLTKLQPETTYYYMLKHRIGESIVDSKVYTATTQVATNKPQTKVNGVKITDVTGSTITVSWDKTENASVYYVYIGEDKVYSKTSDTSMTIKSLELGTTYNIAVVAKLTDGTYQKRSDADSYDVKTLDYEMVDATTTPYTITINWRTTTQAKAWIFYGTSEDNLKVYGSSTTNTFTIKNLEPNTTYYYKLRHNINGQFYDTDVYKTKTVVDEKLYVTAKYTENGTVVSWNEAYGSTKYWLTVEYNGQTSMYSTTDTTYTIKNAPIGSIIKIEAKCMNDGVFSMLDYYDCEVV